MAYLKIENLQLQNYTISLEVENGEAVGVFSRNADIVSDFLKVASGINPGKGCYHEGKSVYDNREYFQNRIFMDFAHNYLTTLRTSSIEEALKNKLGLSFNKEKFIKIGKELNIRGEALIGKQYKFTPAGNTFANYALLQALDKPNIVVLNPTRGLNLPEDIEMIIKGMTDTAVFNTALIGIDRMKPFKGRLSKILVFSDFGTAHVLPGEAQLIVLPHLIEQATPLFTDGEKTIALCGYEKDELKRMQKDRIGFDLISLYAVEDYL